MTQSKTFATISYGRVSAPFRAPFQPPTTAEVDVGVWSTTRRQILPERRRCERCSCQKKRGKRYARLLSFDSSQWKSSLCHYFPDLLNKLRVSPVNPLVKFKKKKKKKKKKTSAGFCVLPPFYSANLTSHPTCSLLSDLGPRYQNTRTTKQHTDTCGRVLVSQKCPAPLILVERKKKRGKPATEISETNCPEKTNDLRAFHFVSAVGRKSRKDSRASDRPL